MVLLALALSFGVPRATRIGATGKYFYFGLPLTSMVVKIGNMGAYSPSARENTVRIPLGAKDALYLLPDGVMGMCNIALWGTLLWSSVWLWRRIRAQKTRKSTIGGT